MPHIVGKKIGGQTYYYLREMARVEGKPKVVSQTYLGKADDIAAAVAGSGPAGVEPERSRHLAFGDLAAVWSVLQRLDVAGIIDSVVGPRRADAAASVGTYLALAVTNRVVDPRSKRGFADWWASTAGDRLVKLPAAALDHRRFWDAMDSLDEQALRAAERQITARMVSEFGLDLSALALDMTNFATFIDSTNSRAPIAQRGHAKQKRTDLRLIGLGLVVTRDGGVPVASHTYRGNAPDVTQFPTLIEELTARYVQAGGERAGLTVVFDAGQNSAGNFARLTAAGLHYVGSLPPADHPELLAIDRRRYRTVDADRFPGLTAHATRTHALGADRRVICTHSQTLHDAQARGFDQTLAKATRALDDIATTLERGHGRRDRAALQHAVDKILRPRWVRRVLTVTLTGEQPSDLRLTYTLDTAARRSLETEIFGKRLLVTDHQHWTVADVVAAYRSQSEAEAGFRQLKDVHVVGFSPMFHWTDSKIRVHAFYCVLALAVVHLMRRQAAAADLDLSVRELLDSLAGIEETVLLYPSTGGRPRARRMLTERTGTQQQLFDLFNLARYAPAS
jgi:transposase